MAVVLREGGVPPAAHFLPTIGALAEAVPDAQSVGIDIPIGLATTGTRQADLAAKAVLGKRRSSVFMTPVRQALEQPTHAAATALSVELTGSGISQQAFALRTKIFEVERWLPTATCGVIEVHPEVSFAVMLGQPAAASKKTWHGLVERLGALAHQGITLDHVEAAVGARVGIDDIVDAAAVAWTARRALAGVARPLPDPPEPGESGRPNAIWA